MTDSTAIVRAYQEYRKARMIREWAKEEYLNTPHWRFIHKRRMFRYHRQMLTRQNELHFIYYLLLKGILPRAHPSRSRKTLRTEH